MTDVSGADEPASDPVGSWAAERTAAGEFPVRPAARSVREGAEVQLREVTTDTVREICALAVAPEQRAFVAPNAVSIAEAHFEPNAWFRAIYADDEPVGFVMLEADEINREYFLWRLMIAADRQGRGYGRRAVELAGDEVRRRPGGDMLSTSWCPGQSGPEGFYLGLGFELTGEIDDGEVVGRLPLTGR